MTTKIQVIYSFCESFWINSVENKIQAQNYQRNITTVMNIKYIHSVKKMAQYTKAVNFDDSDIMSMFSHRKVTK